MKQDNLHLLLLILINANIDLSRIVALLSAIEEYIFYLERWKKDGSCEREKNERRELVEAIIQECGLQDVININDLI